MIAILSPLFPDPQTQGTERPCPNCGKSTYSPSFYCIRCQRDMP